MADQHAQLAAKTDVLLQELGLLHDLGHMPSPHRPIKMPSHNTPDLIHFEKLMSQVRV